jgi:hypothetical protein
VIWRGALLGLVLLAAPALLAFLLPGPEHADRWPVSPPERPLVAAAAPARWDGPARESLALLRRVTATESRRASLELAACETRVARGSAEHRNLRFRRCALRSLARMDGFGSANSRMLASLASTAAPTRACRGRVLGLSGMTGSLSGAARTTLREGFDVSWTELLAMSRTVRAIARDARRLARAPGWNSTCKLRPPARPAPPPVA